MNITVLAGGLSPERNVSLSSGVLIANALIKCGHRVAFADLYLGANLNTSFTDKADFSFSLSGVEPDIELLKKQTGRDEEIGEGIIELCRRSDIVFLALHGGIGENGVLQGILDKEGISYTGSSSESCRISMDKGLSKIEFRKNGIPTAGWLDTDINDKTEQEILDKVGIPCVIKPIDGGSSVGISRVMTRDELRPALDGAKKFGSRIIAEKFIKGREFAVGVLDGKALPPIEIIAQDGFYDYKNKYVKGMAIEKCPCELDDDLMNKAKRTAEAAHKSLGLGSYSRTDMILSEQDGEFYVLEVNALPGMTPTSLLPQEAKADGIGYEELVEKIVNCGKR